MKKKVLLVCSGFLAFIVFPSAIRLIEPENPPLGNTGGPGETTCEQEDCHGGGDFTGFSTLAGLPDTVEPSTEYTVTITLTSDCENAGFQLTALEGDDTKAGILATGTGTNVASFAGRQYVRQNAPRELTGGAASWTFLWTSPATAMDNAITFYFAMLNGNNNEKEDGDKVTINQHSVVMRETLPSAVQTPVLPEITVFPNPTTQEITVTGVHTGAVVSVYNASGRLVQHLNVAGVVAKMDVSELPAGNYHVVAVSDKGRAVQTFSKL